MPKRASFKVHRLRRGAHHIKEWRKFRGLTQYQLAEKIETSAANINRIENGKQDYTQSIIEAIAAALETDVSSLVGYTPQENEPIRRIWERATSEQRQQIEEISQTLMKHH